MFRKAQGNSENMPISELNCFINGKESKGWAGGLTAQGSPDQEHSGSHLKCSFHAWQPAVQGALGKEPGSKCFPGIFPTCLLSGKPPPLCGLFRGSGGRA